jgi:uncharacterized protein YbaA (DUF1428 family)
MKYVDGFVLPVPKRNLSSYRRLSQKAGKIWREFGALEYVEAVGDDLKTKFGTPFPRRVKPKRGEVIVFSWITYRSRKDRDRINAKVMKDPRLAKEMKSMPFDIKRMTYGGFQVLVDV